MTRHHRLSLQLHLPRWQELRSDIVTVCQCGRPSDLGNDRAARYCKAVKKASRPSQILWLLVRVLTIGFGVLGGWLTASIYRAPREVWPQQQPPQQQPAQAHPASIATQPAAARSSAATPLPARQP